MPFVPLLDSRHPSKTIDFCSYKKLLLITRTCFAVPFVAKIIRAINDKIINNKTVNPGSHHASIGVMRRTDNRLAADVKRSVNNDWYACKCAKIFYEIKIKRIHIAANGLETTRAINMNNAGDFISPFFSYGIYHKHIIRRCGNRGVAFKKSIGIINAYGRRKWSKLFAVLNFYVKNFFYIGITWIC